MARYFIVGNIRLFDALSMALFCTFARSDPYMVSFTAWGAWLYTGTDNLLLKLCLLLR